MDLKGKTINFLGDSITEGIGVENKERVYPNIIKEIFGLKRVNNYGIGGTRIADFTGDDPENSQPSFVSRFGQMEDNADVVVVFGGTNDFGHGNAPIGKFGDNTTTTFYGALNVLMKGLIEKYPKAQLVFMTPLHRHNENDQNKYTGESLKKYVEVIREMAEYYAIPVVDLYARSGLQPNVPIQEKLFCPGGLHPNEAGQEKIANCLAGVLKML